MYYEMGYMYAGGTSIKGVHSNMIKELERVVTELRFNGFVLSASRRNGVKEATVLETFLRDDSNVFWYDSKAKSTYTTEMTEFEKFFVTTVFFDSVAYDFINSIYNKIKDDIYKAGYTADDMSIRRAVARSAYFIKQGAVMFINEQELYYVIQYADFVWKIRLRCKNDRQPEKEFTYKISNKKEKNDYDMER